jgi:hypothetical protein
LGCAVDRLRPVDHHRGRNGAGSQTETPRKSRRVTPYRLATAGLHAPLTEPDMRVSRHPALYAWR